MDERDRRRTIRTDERGQALTLEGISAALVLLGAVVFALQITAVTPLTASTSSQHIENQQAAVAEGVITAAVENGTLKKTVLLYNESRREYNGSNDDGVYTLGGPPTPFGEKLNETFRERGIAFDVKVVYTASDGRPRTRQMVNFGVPSDNAVTVRRAVTIYDDDELVNQRLAGTGRTVQNSTLYEDADPTSPIYNVVFVEVTVWRM